MAKKKEAAVPLKALAPRLPSEMKELKAKGFKPELVRGREVHHRRPHAGTARVRIPGVSEGREGRWDTSSGWGSSDYFAVEQGCRPEARSRAVYRLWENYKSRDE